MMLVERLEQKFQEVKPCSILGQFLVDVPVQLLLNMKLFELMALQSGDVLVLTKTFGQSNRSKV